MRRNTKSKSHTNRKMNDETYALRRQVMNLIYEAKKCLDGDMERVEVRITDPESEHNLGTARMSGNVIWIPARTVEVYGECLRAVVYHELCHALWGVDHDDKCALMRPSFDPSNPPTKAACQKLFKKYYNKL